jgi:hypothetical protein
VIPAGAGVLSNGGDGPPVAAAPGSSESATTFDRAGTRSDSTLAGTGAFFLLVGIGTVSVAHRRRWQTIDLRDQDLDAEAKGTRAHA